MQTAQLKTSTLSLAVTPVVVTVNNTVAPVTSGFWGAFSGARHFLDAHPYVADAVIGATVGVAAYFFGGAVFGRTLDSALADPASTVRIIQSNNNLRAEMERIRSVLNETCDLFVDVKLELRRGGGINSIVELAQQGRRPMFLFARQQRCLPLRMPIYC